MCGFVLLLGLAITAGNAYRSPSNIGWNVLLVTVSAGALWWRRSYPTAVFLFIVGVELLNAVFLGETAPSGLAVAFAVFAMSAYGPAAFRRWVVVAAIIVMLAGVALLLAGPFPASNHLIPSGAVSLVAWMAGDFVRSRRSFILELVARHRHDREQAAEEERLRIARELHDVVAHNVSLMAIQAGAARVSGGSSADALQTIETTARDTLAELNRLLGVLRKDSNGPTRAPQPGLTQVDALVKPARDAGLDVSVKVSGEPHPLPAALDLSAYRIVQEAITNVLKHAQASRVEVGIDYRPDALVLTISDNGAGASTPPAASSGHGLIGMRERVDLYGGDLSTASSSLGGFTVRATLPVKT